MSEAFFQNPGVCDGLPVFFPALHARQRFDMAWQPTVRNLLAWREAGRNKVLDCLLQSDEHAPFAPEWIDQQDRGDHVAHKLLFNLTGDSRVQALLLKPTAPPPSLDGYPAVLLLHDHGAQFAIGKEKVIQTWGDETRVQISRAHVDKLCGGRFFGESLVKRGYIVLAVDALGWGDRGGMSFEAQQTLAANLLSLGSSLAGLMAWEDMRSAAFLARLPQVNAQKIAAFGFSMGAYRAWQVAALSPDIRVAVAAHWLATTDALVQPGMNWARGHSAWHMLHPGLARHLDFPDVASLAAPKPMYFLAGEEDKHFPLAGVEQAFEKLHKVWRAWGAESALQTTVVANCAHVFPLSEQDAALDWLNETFSRI